MSIFFPILIHRHLLTSHSTGGMLLFFMAATIAGSQYSKNQNQGVGIAVITFFWLHGVAYAFAWSGLLVAYTVEILPFKLRAKGLMIMNVAVQVALVINNQVNPIPMDGAWKGQEWKLYSCYTAWLFLELLFVWFMYIETRGPTLEEIAIIFDGNAAQVAEVDIKGAPGLHNQVDRFDGLHKDEMKVEEVETRGSS